MKKEDIDKYLNKKVKLTLKNGYIYTCNITKISDTAFDIVDINKEKLTISIEAIDIIKEVSD